MASSSKRLLNAFIIVHLVVILLAGLPHWPLINTLRGNLWAYLGVTGLWQGWNMFAPDPISENVRIEAAIRFTDGTTKMWTSPKMAQRGFARRHKKRRYRKWSERVREERFKIAWPDAARYIARLHADPENPPKTVSLLRRWEAVPPPGMESYQPMPTKFTYGNFKYFFVYPVIPEDLP